MEERELNGKEQRELLWIVRETVKHRLKNEDFNPSCELDGLRQKRGLFVTLHYMGRLRGCIGTFTSDLPLYGAAAKMALSAAFNDPRFEPVSPSEIDKIDIEISVLSSLQEVKKLEDIKVGVHGIYITKGSHRGVLLPQVALEQGWNAEEFIAHTCMKAGLPADAWKKGARIEIFSAQVFGEKEEK